MSVDENATAGTLVGSVIAADLDATAPNKSLTYTATGGTGLGLFEIDPASGAVTVKAGAVLDREAAPDYTLEVMVSDGGSAGPVHDADPDDQPERPERQHAVDQQFARRCRWTRTRPPARWSAPSSRPTSDATAPNNTLTYTATGGTGLALFDIDASTGAVTVKAGVVLDREAAPGYTLDIKVADGATPALFTTQTLTIGLNDLNDNTPSISSSAAMSVDENAAAGTLVGSLIAADLDATAPNNTITYTATGGSGIACSRSMPRPAR